MPEVRNASMATKAPANRAIRMPTAQIFQARYGLGRHVRQGRPSNFSGKVIYPRESVA